MATVVEPRTVRDHAHPDAAFAAGHPGEAGLTLSAAAGAVVGAVVGTEVGVGFPELYGSLGTILGSGLAAVAWGAIAALRSVRGERG